MSRPTVWCSFQFLSFVVGFELMAEAGSSKRRLLVVPGPSYGTPATPSVVYPNNPRTVSHSIKNRSVLQVKLRHEDIIRHWGVDLYSSIFSSNFPFGFVLNLPIRNFQSAPEIHGRWRSIMKHPHVINEAHWSHLLIRITSLSRSFWLRPPCWLRRGLRTSCDAGNRGGHPRIQVTVAC